MNSNVVRAWKDEFYRQSLSDEERAQLPENPVGELELTDAEMESVFAGKGIQPVNSIQYKFCEISYDDRCHTHYIPARECVRHHFTIDYGNCYTYYPCHQISYNTLKGCHPPLK